MSDLMNDRDVVHARPELLQVAETVARDKGVNQDEILEAMEQAIQKAGRSKSDAEQFLNATLSTIQDTLSSGESIPLVGFGTFSVASRAARTGKNPQTGAAIQIPASKTVKFKVGSKLKDAVNN